MQHFETDEHGVGEECGVFGAFDRDGGNVAPFVYYGICSLQHRGQESCGIAVSETQGPPNNVQYHKDLGLVSEVFKKKDLEVLCGDIGIGHCRYSTTGAPSRENAQPLVLNYVKGTISLAHNGNLINTAELRNELEYNGAIFHTTTDSELIAYLIARERVRTPSIEAAVKNSVKRLEGGFALVVMSPRKLIAVRDPLGLKPLCLGIRDNMVVVASESCAIKAAGARFVRDIEPGEIVTITQNEVKSDMELAQEKHARCVFEYIYFARLDSRIDGVSVYDARIRAGRLLARTAPVDADIVAGVPDSGLTAARGYALEAGIPFEIIFYKNSYIGRTFIKPTQAERETSVKLKLSVLEPAVKGKKIVLVDDSIVRGTTMANLITMLKQAGAEEVHVRISAPPFLYPCYYGTDVPSNSQLIASSHTEEEICRIIGADSLAYMRIGDLPEMAGHKDICAACFDQNYPTRIPVEDHMRGVKE
ncbi:MAG: amidophosphoribosyltransferase [Bilifractor sp.]|jgi:amidophosphoribosyltransferase